MATCYKNSKAAWDAAAGAGRDGKIPRANMQKFLGTFWRMPGIDNNWCMGYWDTCDAWDSKQPGVTHDQFVKTWVVCEYRSIIELIG